MQEAARLKDQQVLEAQQANAALLARCEGAELNFRRHVEAMRSVEAAQAGAAAVGRASQGIRSSEDANCFDGSLSHCDATFRGACSLSLPRPCDDDSASEASGYHKGSAAPSSCRGMMSRSRPRARPISWQTSGDREPFSVSRATRHSELRRPNEARSAKEMNGDRL